MYNVRLCQSDSDQIVHVSGEALETGLVAHEAMDVDEQQFPSAAKVLFFWKQRLSGGRARIM